MQPSGVGAVRHHRPLHHAGHGAHQAVDDARLAAVRCVPRCTSHRVPRRRRALRRQERPLAPRVHSQRRAGCRPAVPGGPARCEVESPTVEVRVARRVAVGCHRPPQHQAVGRGGRHPSQQGSTVLRRWRGRRAPPVCLGVGGPDSQQQTERPPRIGHRPGPQVTRTVVSLHEGAAVLRCGGRGAGAADRHQSPRTQGWSSAPRRQDGTSGGYRAAGRHTRRDEPRPVQPPRQAP